MRRIIITNFTDPVCVWCWGTEPVFRALETHYPDQIEFRYVMGGLVDNIDNFADPGSGITASSKRANDQIMSHWLESSSRHGMPINPEGFHLFSKEYPSTYPQNIAYKAAQLADPKKADAFLRRIREATLTQGKVTSEADVQLELASEVGIELAGFIKALRGGEAELKFKTDLAITRISGVTGFPSFSIKTSQAREALVRGFKTYGDFREVISYLTDDSLGPVEVKPSFEALNDLMQSNPKLALEEVRQAFDFASQNEAEEWLEPFIGDNILIREEAGTSYFVRKGSAQTCDIASGIYR